MDPDSLPAAGVSTAPPSEKGVAVPQIKRVIQQATAPTADEVPANRIFLRDETGKLVHLLFFALLTVDVWEDQQDLSSRLPRSAPSTIPRDSNEMPHPIPSDLLPTYTSGSRPPSGGYSRPSSRPSEVVQPAPVPQASAAVTHRRNIHDANSHLFQPADRRREPQRDEHRDEHEARSRPNSGNSMGNSSSATLQTNRSEGRKWDVSAQARTDTVKLLAQQSVANILSASSAGDRRERRGSFEEPYADELFDGEPSFERH